MDKMGEVIEPQFGEELSSKELVDLAREAVDELDVEKKPGEDFPGALAFKKVIKVVATVEITGNPTGNTTETWQKQYREWQKAFDETEDPEETLAEMKSMLEGALDSAERALEKEE